MLHKEKNHKTSCYPFLHNAVTLISPNVHHSPSPSSYLHKVFPKEHKITTTKIIFLTRALFYLMKLNIHRIPSKRSNSVRVKGYILKISLEVFRLNY